MNEQKKSPVKEKLHSVRKYDLAAEVALAEYESILSDIVRITPSYGGVSVKSSSSADFSGGLDRLRSSAEKVMMEWDRYIDARADAAEIISAMGEWPDEMKCLQLRYLTYRDNPGWRLTNWDTVAKCMNVSRRQATNIHGQALRHFEQIWKSRTDYPTMA